MDIKLDKKLVKKFPLLYTDRHADMRTTAMCWGFECGNGWFDIIYKLSATLEKEIKKFKCQYPNSDYVPKATQVKEKYGTLRFYMSTSTEKMDEAIRIAENKSSTTCEECGKPGSIRDNGWLYTRCNKCWSTLTKNCKSIENEDKR